MTFLLYVLLGVLIAILVIGLAAWLFWRHITREERRVIKRIYALPMRRKIGLAGSLWRDDRIPLGIRLIPPLLVLYLAMPLDLIPDFIPVVGQLDDVLVVLVGVSLLLRFVGRDVLEEHISAFELLAAEDRSASQPARTPEPAEASSNVPPPARVFRLRRPRDGGSGLRH